MTIFSIPQQTIPLSTCKSHVFNLNLDRQCYENESEEALSSGKYRITRFLLYLKDSFVVVVVVNRRKGENGRCRYQAN